MMGCKDIALCRVTFFVLTKSSKSRYNIWREDNMNEREMMKLAETLDEFSMSDYTVAELEQMSSRDRGYSKYKEKYFEYYDDVKDKTLSKQDW